MPQTIRKIALKLAFIGALSFASTPAAANDKVYHLGVSFLMTTVLYAFAYKLINGHSDNDKWTPLIAAAALTLLVGVAVEAMDAGQYGRFDYEDMLANTAGVAAAGLTIKLLEF